MTDQPKNPHRVHRYHLGGANSGGRAPTLAAKCLCGWEGIGEQAVTDHERLAAEWTPPSWREHLATGWTLPADLAAPESVSLAEAKEWLEDRKRDGARCPCCDQWTKVYRRKLGAGIAYSMVRIARRYSVGEPFRTPGLGLTHDPGMARHWGLLDRYPQRGVWALTDLGYRWVHRQCKVPRWVLLYDNHLVGVDGTDGVDVVTALGDRFDYQELMSA